MYLLEDCGNSLENIWRIFVKIMNEILWILWLTFYEHFIKMLKRFLKNLKEIR